VIASVPYCPVQPPHRWIAAGLLTSCLALLPGAQASAQELPAEAWQAAERAAESVVLVEYVLEKNGRGFGATTPRTELAAVGVVGGPDGLVLISDNIFPEDADDFRQPARPHSFRVRRAPGEHHDAELVGRDDELGLAFLRLVEGSRDDFSPLSFEHLGPRAIGSPLLVVSLLPEKFEFRPTIQTLRVSARLDDEGLRHDLDGFLQDAAVGCPVLDEAGRVVGLIASDRFEGSDPGPLSFPLKLISAVTRGKAAGFPHLLSAEAFAGLLTAPPEIPEQAAPKERAWIGITLQEVSPHLAEALGVSDAGGVRVTSIWPDSPAGKAGIQVGDLIVSFDGEPVVASDVSGVAAFIERVQQSTIGRGIDLKVFRKGRRKTLELILGTAPTSSVQAAEYRSEALGLAAQDLTLDIVQGQGWPDDTRGALINDLETAGRAQVAGLQRGDLILAVDRQPVAGVDDLERRLGAAIDGENAELVLFVLREPDTLFVVIPLE
jgi:S1-C subfamily serine protease